MTAAALPASKGAAPWTMVPFAMMGVAVCSTPIAILSLSVFFIPLGETLGWGRGEVAAALSILALAMGAATPFAGRMIDRFGVRPVLVTSLLLYGVVMAATPFFIEQAGLWGFYGAYTVIGVVGAGSNTVAYTHVLSGWFDKTRGLVLGFAMSGIAIGAVIGPALAAYLIANYSWQAGFYGLAALPIIVGLPIALFAIREAPRLAAAHETAAVVPGISASAAYKTRAFWTLFMVFLFVATSLHGVQIHLPSLLSDRGLSTEMAVAGFSLLFAVTAVTRVVAGFLFDRIFAPLIGGVLFLLAAVGIALLVPQWATFYYLTAAVLIGIGTGAESDLLAYLVSRYFGMKAFGQIYGGLFSAFMIGSAVGPYVLGYGFDTFGSYNPVLIACVIGMCLAFVMLMTLPKFPTQEALAAAAAERP